MTYDSLKRFMSLIHAFHTVERVATVPTLARQTNGPEHTYQLAMLAWYVVSTKGLTLNLEKVLMYTLAHDLVEAYAGDTYIFDESAIATKHDREMAALARIREEYREFSQLIEIIEAYERRGDEESVFVYALDKLIDPLNALMDDARPWWKEHNVSYETLRSSKDQKIANAPHVEAIWNEITAELERRHDTFFAGSDTNKPA